MGCKIHEVLGNANMSLGSGTGSPPTICPQSASPRAATPELAVDRSVQQVLHLQVALPLVGINACNQNGRSGLSVHRVCHRVSCDALAHALPHQRWAPPLLARCHTIACAQLHFPSRSVLTLAPVVKCTIKSALDLIRRRRRLWVTQSGPTQEMELTKSVAFETGRN